VEKELAVGNGFMRVSQRRPEWDFSEALLHPAETLFPPGSVVQSIDVQYESRPSWTSGSDYWLIYWFCLSLIAGFLFRGVFKVNL
jgi:hypothetical protein